MESCKLKNFILVSISCLVAACVTDSTHYTWVKSSMSYNEQERAAAESECLFMASQSFQTTTLPSDTCIGFCNERGGGFSRGVLASAAVRQNREAAEMREKFYETCMQGKGWQKKTL